MIRFLSTATFDFAIANKLSGELHKDAFIEICDHLIHSIKGWFDSINEIAIISKNIIKFDDIEQPERNEENFIYIMPVDIFFNKIRVYAAQLYFSENSVVTIRLKGDCELDILVAMDPIYVSISKA